LFFGGELRWCRRHNWEGKSMRYTLAAVVLLACSSTFAFGQAAAPSPMAAGPAQQFDVPSQPSYVAIVSREFAPGQAAGRHIHHGVEMTIVVRGDIELAVDGQPTRVYHAGESFMVPRDTPHDAKNVGAAPATIAVTYVLDKGAALRDAAPEKK
jgi:quercetin dioxygenase-like cupin family protein